MSNTELPNEYSPQSWIGKFLSDIREIPLPKSIENNLIRSISRLIIGAFDVPIAILKEHERRISRETEALDLISKSNAETVARFNAENPELIQNLSNYYALEQFQKSKNRKAIIELATNEIVNNRSTQSTSNTISDLWLNRFCKIAEDITSKDLQTVFSKILAGEINRPGTFSLSTLNVLNNLDSKLAHELKDLTRITLWLPSTKESHRLACIPDFDRNEIMFNQIVEFDVNRRYAKLIDVGILRYLSTENEFLQEILRMAWYVGNKQIYFDPPATKHNNKMKFDAFTFTDAGKELFFLVEKLEPLATTKTTYINWFRQRFEEKVRFAEVSF